MQLPPEHGETLQGQRYLSGQYFRAHRDFFHVGEAYWPRMRAEGGQRSWTAMIYLNTLEEGVETPFPSLAFRLSPRPGLPLLWHNMPPDAPPTHTRHPPPRERV